MTKVEVRSPCDGTFAYQHVDDGVSVEEGEAICDVEIMKMMNSIMSPASGIVRFHVALGEVVAYDDLIAVIEVG